MTAPAPTDPAHPDAICAFKSRSGWQRLVRATGYSMAGLRAAWRHEAAFRQELMVAVPLLVVAWVFAPDRWQALLLTGSLVLVCLAELLNSAIEAIADAVSLHAHPLLGRAKDMASAAVLLSVLLSALCFAVVFWPL